MGTVSKKKKHRIQEVPYGAAALEENDLLAWPGTVAKRAHSLGRLVGISSQEIVQALVTDGSQEPLTSPIYQHGVVFRSSSNKPLHNIHVRSRKTAQRRVAQRRILDQHRTLHLHSS